MYLHKEGKIAEYTIDYADHTGAYYNITHRPDTRIWFGNRVWVPAEQNYIEGYFEQRDEALQAAMNYHEEEGCKLYLELYPAPEKGEWAWIAQDCNGWWYGYAERPFTSADFWFAPKSVSKNTIVQMPINPFWRKTLR